VIDWVTFLLPYTHRDAICDGHVLEVDPDGVQRWLSPKMLPVEGSYSNKLHVRSYGSTDDGGYSGLYVSGNPAKFIQGHNLFGTNDLRGLVDSTVQYLANTLSLQLTPADRQRLDAGDIELYRIDINESWELASQSHVDAWLRSAEHCAHMRHRGQGIMTKGTLYFGKNSRRSGFKFYSKGTEINAGSKHALPRELDTPEMQAWASNKLRGELTLRRLKLKDIGLQNLNQWQPTTPTELFENQLQGLTMNDTHTLPAETVAGLPPRLILVYEAWKQGHDLRATLPKNTFYRYRRELTELAGIDIAVRQPRDASLDNVIPLRVVLAPQYAGIPDFAKGTPLYFEPSRKAG